MKPSSSYVVLCVLASLALRVYPRPSAQIKHQQTLADLLGEEITALLSAEERVDAAADEASSSSSSAELRFPPAHRPLRDAADSAQQAPNRTWLRYFSDFMNNQKKFRGRTKKTSQGCFGFKLDRIGSYSGLGC
ncbi:C-type natriuretic peptide-like [Lissotriton helveticus]